MPLERAFAINAEPAAIWRALTGELEVADEGGYEVERAVPNELLSIWVGLDSGIRARITYQIIPRDGHTEVVASIEPEGLRNALFRIVTFGRADINYEIMLTEGLANLKRAVEAEAAGA